MHENAFLAWTSSRLRRAGYLRKWLVLGVVIGLVAGLGAIAFTVALRWSTQLFLVLAGGYTPPAPAGEGATAGSGAHLVRPWILPLIVGLGGLISGILVFGLAPEAEGHGTDAAIAAVHHDPKEIRAGVSFVKVDRVRNHDGSGVVGTRGSDGADQRRLRIDARPVARPYAIGRTDRGDGGIGSGFGAIFRAPLAARSGAEVVYRDDVEANA